MDIFLPDNIFTRILSSCFPDDVKSKVAFLPSAQITQKIENNSSAVGLIPVLDLLIHKNLNVSGNYGISFEGSLGNSYIYYSKEKDFNNKISLAGDVSSQEVVLSKIIFKELYGSDIELEIVTDLNKADDKNLLIIGDENFNGDRCLKGVSFAEILIDVLSLPYVNYIFASANKETLENFIKSLSGIETVIYNKVEEEKFVAVSSFEGDKDGRYKEYIRSNISSFVLEFDEQDREGIEQILRLPYFHGMVSDIVEVQFV